MKGGLQELVHKPGSDLFPSIRTEVASSLLRTPVEWRERVVHSVVPLDEHYFEEQISVQFKVNPWIVWDAASWVLELAGLAGQSSNGHENEGYSDLSTLDADDWVGEVLTLDIPLLTMPKQLTLRVDLKDGVGESKPLTNRLGNSLLAEYQLRRRLFDENFSTLPSSGTPGVLRALTHCIPGSLVHPSRFDDDPDVGAAHARALESSHLSSSTLNDAAEAMGHFLTRTAGPVLSEASSSPSLLDLLARGRWLAEELDQRYRSPMVGLQNPLTNPLLLWPDYQWLRYERVYGSTPGAEEKESFIHACIRLQDLVRGLLLRSIEERDYSAHSALADLVLYCHSWPAFVRMPVRLGESQLLKFRSTNRVFMAHPKSKRREFGESVARKVWPDRKVVHGYPFYVGYAKATHLEILSPDTSAIRIAAGKASATYGARMMKGPYQIRALFELEHSSSEQTQAFYTARTRESLGREFGHQHDKVVLFIHYRLRDSITTLYWMTTIYAALIATALIPNWPWEHFPFRDQILNSPWSTWIIDRFGGLADRFLVVSPALNDASGTIIVALTATVLGTLANRERATVAARCSEGFRWRLGILLGLLFLDLLFRIFGG